MRSHASILRLLLTTCTLKVTESEGALSGVDSCVGAAEQHRQHCRGISWGSKALSRVSSSPHLPRVITFVIPNPDNFSESEIMR
jgi:hypothetical protein